MNAPISGAKVAPDAGYRSKTVATWLAVVGGVAGLHRFYLYGLRDALGWCHAPLALVGLVGVQRMRAFGVDDHVAWVLIPVLGLVLAAAMLSALVYGLMPDERWNARFNRDAGREHRTGWSTILGVIVALVLGAGILMATLAFSAQRYFEYQAEQAHARP
jgi:hypothetical protein